jgi:glycosyltransferase involved in cell wall biosynthesis
MFILTLQTSTFGIYGGIPTYNRLVCRSLDEFAGRAMNRILLATDKSAAAAQHASELPGLTLEPFNGNRMAFIRRIFQLAMTRRIDLLLVGHVNYAPIGYLLKRLQPEMRYGVMIYGVEVWSMLSRFRQRALQHADFVISISEYTKQRAVQINGVAAERVYLLPNALEWITEGAEAEYEPDRLPRGMRLLTVCRLDSTEQYKGVDTVIESLPEVSKQVPDLQYLIVGSGGDVERLKALVIKIGVADRVHFLGSVDDKTLRAYYKSCDVFVMPSAKEGFGFVFLEAMQYGKPVIAANIGGSPEVVQDGLTGLLVQYGNIAQLAEAITDLSLHPEKRLRMGAAGYQRLQDNYTFPPFREKLTNILTREIPVATLYKNRRRLISGNPSTA